MILFHYTCEYNAMLIDASKILRTRNQPMFDDLPMVFLTTIIRPAGRHQLGLTYHIGRPECARNNPPCEPVAARFSVLVDPRSDSIMPFNSILRHWPGLKALYESFDRAVLGSWWVSSEPLRIHVPDKPRSPLRKGARRGTPASSTHGQ